MADSNSAIIDQITEQVRRGMEANLRSNEFSVVQTRISGVLSVLASSAVSDEYAVVFGPASFEECIARVNGHLVTRPLAGGDVRALHKAARAGAPISLGEDES
jgi:hypothetical protein